MKTLAHLAPGQRLPVARRALDKLARELMRAGLTTWEVRQVFEGETCMLERLEHRPEEAKRFRDEGHLLTHETTLRDAALDVLRSVYVGNGKFIAPNALEEPLRNLAKVIKEANE